jgi:hypothetical protein
MKINNECHHHAKYFWCDRCNIQILNIIYFLQIVTNHNANFIFKEKVVEIKLINEYSFQRYQFIIVFLSTIFQILFVSITSYFICAIFKNFLACECRNIIFQCRNNFDKLLMWNLNDDVFFITNFDIFVLKTIIIVVWNTKILYIFSFVQVVFAKSFEDFRTFFFLTMLISSMRKLIFLEISTFKNAFSISRRSFAKFDVWKQRKLFFREKKLFSLFNDLIFRKNEIISLFFIETFCLDISIVTKMLIVDADSNSDDDVLSNVDNWKISIDDEISFFIIDFEKTFFRELFNTCFRIDILSYCFSSLFLNIYNEIARYVT